MKSKSTLTTLIKASARIPLSTYQAGLLQSKSHRALTSFMTSHLAPFGISLPEWAALGVTHDQWEIRPTEVANLLGVKPPVATNLMNQLQQKGYLRREQHDDDSRGVVICLTDQGEELVVEAEKKLRVALRDFLDDISISELLTYVKVLTKLSKKI